MEKEKVDSSIIDRFVERYLEKLCDPTPKDILKALVGDNITDPERLRNYMICHDFQLKLVENCGRVGQTYVQLAMDFDLEKRQIERIIARWREKFMRCKSSSYDTPLKKVS